ncbi:MAG: hypothetical protein J6Y56_02520 [Fibrobacterales bacterium]|nr:hypothetical protein [Fibrobacterales bacterium]
MRNVWTALAMGTLLLVTGCYTGPTPYVEGTSGYSLDRNRKVAGFHGNGYTSKSRAHRFAMLHAAEICDASGFSHFVVVGSGDYSTQHSYTSPTHTEYEYNARTNKVEATTYGGHTSSWEKPVIELEVMCLDVANRQHRTLLKEAYDCAPLVAQIGDEIRADEQRIYDSKRRTVVITVGAIGAVALMALLGSASSE